MSEVCLNIAVATLVIEAATLIVIVVTTLRGSK
jgi:hypothetical protein